MEHTIEKQIEIKAPVSKVWQALTDSKLFCQWFGAKGSSPFEVGKKSVIINTHHGSGDTEMSLMIKDIRPESYFSYLWKPYPFNLPDDLEDERPTLVEFFLEPIVGGTLVKVKESGFNQINAKRRAEAFKMHSSGWDYQLKNIKEFLHG